MNLSMFFKTLKEQSWSNCHDCQLEVDLDANSLHTHPWESMSAWNIDTPKNEFKYYNHDFGLYKRDIFVGPCVRVDQVLN